LSVVGWEFLRRYLDPSVVDAFVFTRRAFAPAWVPAATLHEIPPSIDPFSPKNQDLSTEESEAMLVRLASGAGDRGQVGPDELAGTIGDELQRR
jgi:trehalose synthase